MWCIDCEYKLVGVPDSRCPECGRAFDPDDPSTYRTTIVQHRRALGLLSDLLATAAGEILAVVLVVGGCLFLSLVTSFHWAFVLVGIALVVVALVVLFRPAQALAFGTRASGAPPRSVSPNHALQRTGSRRAIRGR